MNGHSDSQRIASGTPGLDTVLRGGLIAGQTTVVGGGPGTGKTVLALQFLAAGDGDGLYVGFEERERDLRANAASLGIDLDGVAVLDLSADGDRFFDGDSYSVFPSEEVEGEGLLERVASTIDREDPDRLVVDPLSELRSLLPDEFQFRRKVSSLFNDLKRRKTTTLCTTHATSADAGTDLQFLGDATIELRRTTDHRSLEVTKFRGSGSATGRHTYRIRDGEGARLYPKLVPGEFLNATDRARLATGVDGLDSLLGGGIERGSVTVVSGPSGVGKTTTGTLFLRAAAERGEGAVAFLFEELADDFRYRAGELGLGIEPSVEDGLLDIREIESLTRSPDEFAHAVRTAVEEDDPGIVMLDGTAGYRLGLRGDDSETALTRELHALCRYLKRMGVAVVLIEEVPDITGQFRATDERISYLADNIVFLRYLELDGEVSKAIGVLKKRFGPFEQSLRALTIDGEGVVVGERLTGLRGVLTGTPERVTE